jgi:hypothetical protein
MGAAFAVVTYAMNFPPVWKDDASPKSRVPSCSAASAPLLGEESRSNVSVADQKDVSAV